MEPQNVDDRVLGVLLGHLQRLIGDIGVLFAVVQGGDAHGVALKLFGQLGNHRRHGGREQQGAAPLGGFGQHEFQIFAEPEVQHLVRFVQNDGADVAEVQRAALDVIDQTARCAHNDMRATFQRTAFIARVHPADTGRNARARLFVQPAQFAHHLKRQFAGGGHD